MQREYFKFELLYSNNLMLTKLYFYTSPLQTT